MPILSFSSQDIDIITGKKTMTIRKLWKTPLKKGDRLYCYWNLVSKEKKKIFEAKVLDVQTIPFSDLKDNDELARKEGFESAVEMVKDFKKMYAGKIEDSELFQIIYFEKLDVNDWKGDKIDEKAMISKEECMITITRDGYIKRVSMRSYNASSESMTQRKDTDSLVCYGASHTLQTLVFFTNRGTYGYIPVYQIEEAKWKDLGGHISNYIKMDSSEKIIAAYVLDSFKTGVHVISASRHGMIKRTELKEFEVSRSNKTMACMKIGAMDEMISVSLSYKPAKISMSLLSAVNVTIAFLVLAVLPVTIPRLLFLPSMFMVLTLATFVPSNIFSTASLIMDLFASG